MKNNKKQLFIIISSICLLLFISISGVYAWFINYSNNVVDSNTITVNSGSVMELKFDEDDDYSNSASINFGELNLIDITGDGITFYRPVLTQSSIPMDEDNDQYYVNVATVDSSNTWRTPKSTAECLNNDYSDADYIVFDVYFKANVLMGVYLSNESSISPNLPSGHKSNYGAGDSFSKDWIAAASRVAFIDMTNIEGDPTSSNIKMVWVPNANVELYYDYDQASSEKGYKLNTSGTKESQYSYYYFDSLQNDYVKHDYLSTEKITTSIKTTSRKKDASESPITTLVKNDETNYYEGHIRVVIWIEGTDREARRALAGGIMDMNLIFTGFDVGE